MEQNKQPRPRKRHLLRSKKQRDVNNPHKRAPEVYFKHIYFSEPAHIGIKYISRVKKKSIGETANELMMQTIKDYIVGIVRDAARYEVELNELYQRGIDEKNARISGLSYFTRSWWTARHPVRKQHCPVFCVNGEILSSCVAPKLGVIS